MFWIDLTTEEQLAEVVQKSYQRPQLLFKHSTRCGISHHAKFKLDSALTALAEAADVYYVDLLNYRMISQQIAQSLSVVHQSPQVIVLKDGKVVHTASHQAIVPEKIMSVLVA